MIKLVPLHSSLQLAIVYYSSTVMLEIHCSTEKKAALLQQPKITLTYNCANVSADQLNVIK